MTIIERIDYTAWRLGRHTPDGEIVRCATCGKKGAYRPASTVMPEFVVHRMEVDDLGHRHPYDIHRLGPQKEA